MATVSVVVFSATTAVVVEFPKDQFSGVGKWLFLIRKNKNRIKDGSSIQESYIVSYCLLFSNPVVMELCSRFTAEWGHHLKGLGLQNKPVAVFNPI